MKDDKADRFRLYDRHNEKEKDVPQRKSLFHKLCIAHSSKSVWVGLFGDHIGSDKKKKTHTSFEKQVQ